MSYVYIVQDEQPSHQHSLARYHANKRKFHPFRRGSFALFRRGTKRHARWRAGDGALDALKPAIEDLSAAVWGRGKNNSGIDREQRRWGLYANNLGVALFDAYGLSKKPGVLDDSIEYLRAAAEALPDTGPARARALANLISVLDAHPGSSRAGRELPDPQELRRELSMITAAPVHERLAAAASWGYSAAEASGPAEGLAGLATAVELLPQAAWWGYGRTERAELLAGHTGLATDAAACAMASGRPARALELLEGGRAVLWTQLLKTRGDRSRLRDVAPRLAKKMDRVALALENDGGMSTDARVALVKRWSRLDGRANAKLQRDWSRLAERAQRLVPDGSFTTPVYTADIGPAGAEGPVVVVIVSRLSCGALVVHDRDAEPLPVELPDLDFDDAHTRAQRYMTALAEGEGREREDVIGETLDWLWRVITSPVLDAIGQKGIAEIGADDADPPRLWWSATGPLGTLPLHAAAPRESRDGRPVLDQVVSSYAPALPILVHARERRDAAAAGGAPAPRLLYVGEDRGPGQAALPGAARTRALIERLVPEDRRTMLTGGAAIRESVEAQLPRHTWTHFDCHGVQDLEVPFESGLVLRDGFLTVSDLTRLRNERAEFAFLGACVTAAIGTALPDEVITLTSALQCAGYPAVIGTLSSVPDSTTARIAQSVYTDLTGSGGMAATGSAHALNNAVREERTRRPHHPSAWVSFLHLGL
ncbi:CHAT domain-containing protein [Spirillospora sp. NPDC047418]